MSDSLIIEGKQYISSRRAAEIAGYSNDYVGQLCRAGKLACRMVGRFWYVDLNSILRHKNEFIKPNQTVFKKADQIQPVNAGILQTEKPSILTDKNAAEKTQDLNKIFISKIEPPPAWEWTDLRSPATKAMSSISHAARSPYALISPTLAALAFLIFMTAAGNSRLHPEGLISGASSLESASVEGAMVTVQSFESAMEGAGDALASAWSTLSSKASDLASNAISLVSSQGARQLSGGSVMSQATDTAVGSSADQTIGEPSLSSVVPSGEQGRVTAEHGGVVVLPSTGSSSDQAKLEKSIQNSFSDAVTIKPNADGTTGVIRPVFRTVAGHDFLYVLVPVKATSTSAVN